MLARFSPYWLWLVLALPALGMAYELATSVDPKVYRSLVHPTGEFSARFLIITLMATPLMMLLRGWRGPRWLLRNRRYFGVASFAYAAAHTLFYVLNTASMDKLLSDLTRFDIAAGWLAFLIFLPLAATSYDGAVRWMGPRWKMLQRATYAAAVLTLLHWAALHNWAHPVPALIQFAPLAALSAWRLWWNFLRPRPGLPA